MKQRDLDELKRAIPTPGGLIELALELINELEERDAQVEAIALSGKMMAESVDPTHTEARVFGAIVHRLGTEPMCYSLREILEAAQSRMTEPARAE